MLFSEIDYIGFFDNNKVYKNQNCKDRPVIMFEIDFCTEDGGVVFIDGVPIPIKKNSVFCNKPGQKRYTKGILKCFYLHFEVKNEKLRDLLMHLPNAFLVENENEYKTIFSDMHKYFNKNTDDCKIMLESLILKLVYRLKKDSTDAAFFEGIESKQTETIKNAVKYIKEHLNEDLSLETLSKQFSFSPIYFHNSFKAVMNKTLREFVEERRIKKSIELLQSINIPLSQIAYECGFTSQSYFCYAFKRYTVTTPRKYVLNFIEKL
jgi:AraC-like DNA-binding protein